MKKFLTEFREFALQGNVMSMAVGVIIGVSFQGLVTSLTDNILSPIIGLFIRQNFDFLELNFLGINLRYGAFITTLLNFLIMAFVVFLLVKSMNKLLACTKPKATQESTPTPDRYCPFCFSVIHQDATRCHACTSVLLESRE